MAELECSSLTRNGPPKGALGVSAGPVAVLPDDVLIGIMEWLRIPDLVRQTHVCQHWRNTLIHCASLWGCLDLAYAVDRAPSVLRALLPRTGETPLDVSLRLDNPAAVGDTNDPWTALAPHVHRLRHVSLDATSMTQFEALFALLAGPLPLLTSLEVSPAARPYARGRITLQPGLFAHAPRLARVIWGIHALPSPLNHLGNVTHIDIRCTPVGSHERIFSQFPRATFMSLCPRRAADIEPLPTRHPLQHLELHGHLGNATKTLWADVTRLGFTSLPMLVLHNCTLGVLPAACTSGSDWRADSLSIDRDDIVSATPVCGAARCEMHGMANVHGDWSVARLLGDSTCLASLRSFTTSVVRRRFNTRPGGFLPHAELPALTTLTLVCSLPRVGAGTGPWDSLLDDPLLRGAGVLRAPQLRTLIVRGDGEGNDSVTAIAPLALAWFLHAHVQLQDGRELPELRLDGPRVQFTDPPGDALFGLVGNIHDKL